MGIYFRLYYASETLASFCANEKQRKGGKKVKPEDKI